ncbi:unnamed protein product [Soboliphyme baturini]|uniref:Uncharacterized protein n=1 Tax=Soboliphyme baturini TaxID=241478 RepID=A0A183IDX9_9BILA|nr:unnamed protein product [Soboliphyme baturini]
MASTVTFHRSAVRTVHLNQQSKAGFDIEPNFVRRRVQLEEVPMDELRFYQGCHRRAFDDLKGSVAMENLNRINEYMSSPAQVVVESKNTYLNETLAGLAPSSCIRVSTPRHRHRLTSSVEGSTLFVSPFPVALTATFAEACQLNLRTDC